MLFARLPSDGELWTSLTSTYKVDVNCGLFLTDDRGFCLSPEVSKLFSDRHLEVGFNVYFDTSQNKSA